MILNIPHAATLIPPEYHQQYHIDIRDELNVMTDWFVDELFQGLSSGSAMKPFAYSRFFCDVERLSHDEPMDQVGMEICYEKTHDGKQLRTLSDADKQEIVNQNC
ncbi:MAG: N-formylglutamate amidohydrolase [Desulfobulbaceae bacterium]|nr:N-formylglutamate amidohydrolase [Desulfobulbaceae bacterium]